MGAPEAPPAGGANIARYLPANAARFPHKRAVVFPEGRDRAGRPTYSQLTFSQLDGLSSQFARGLKASGVDRGQRVLLMVRPSLEFLALTFGLFRLGAVPVLIDPGMGLKNLITCVEESEPETMVAVSLAQALGVFFPKAFRSVERRVTVGWRWFWGGETLDSITHPDASPYLCASAAPGDPAAILFTTGSTGPPKGVRYTHGIFDSQVRRIRDTYGITEDDVDMPGFPLFGLYSVAWGMTSVIPDMDPTRPAQVDPVKIREAIENHGVTTSFGSPAIWRRVGEYCEAEDVTFPTMKRILMAGAPVPGETLAQFEKILPHGDTFTPYGCTECLPVASISGREVVEETWGATRIGRGVCVGLPLAGATVKILEVLDDEIDAWDEGLVLPDGEVGEIAVRSEFVTPGYFNRDESTRLAKIRDGENLWHRMGDLGYLDEEGRLWFCGRKGHRVDTAARRYLSVCCEGIFNEHPSVARSALVEVDGLPAIVVQPQPDSWPASLGAAQRLTLELRVLGAASEVTSGIEQVFFHGDFPVDIRHNAKIFREKLTVWAQAKSDAGAQW